MNFWGIDPGYARLGYGIVALDGQRLVYRTHGVLETPAAQNPSQRLLYLEKELKKLLRRFPPKASLIEDIFVRKNITSGIRVAEARGVVLLTLARVGSAIYEATPTAVKKTLTGDGQATKDVVQRMIKKLLALSEIPQPDDAADALACALLAVSKFEQSLLRARTG
ncbi:MAG: crossover junction endodeoxyribonuclease RuvC [Leptospiraceae bacterium]|nr:crossover junction endodeoxyribonuclease RuvC [Leptospiraceae bacterium]MDW8306610.1 crossover junction endodeoxyribonuclease RuvC [Leptospiraceae bacterium]